MSQIKKIKIEHGRALAPSSSPQQEEAGGGRGGPAAQQEEGDEREGGEEGLLRYRARLGAAGPATQRAHRKHRTGATARWR